VARGVGGDMLPDRQRSQLHRPGVGPLVHTSPRCCQVVLPAYYLGSDRVTTQVVGVGR
jgi:hypothetical protein